MRRFIPLLLFAAGLPAAAQIITGSITGSVKDPSGLAVPDVTLRLQHIATGRERQASTDGAGDFVFAGLESGEYRLIAAKEGFKQVEKRGIPLPSGVRLPVGTLVLELGAVSETVSVTADRAIVQTQSAERADVITSSQVENLQILGRNVPSLVQLLPGVVMLEEPAGLDRRTLFSTMGNRNTNNQVTVDGLPSTDLGNGFALKLQQSMDAVAEVRILLSNYQAEYGNASGANVEMVLKSGTRDFHGLGSYFKRHEQFNANDFFNNRLGVPKPRYRYNTWTYNLGGPVYVPARFNRNKDRMFFFWTQEFWPRRDASVYRLTTPTELERNGDFSQSVDLNNRLVVVRDPFNNLAPFAGNRVPANRLDRNGVALLKLFPLPNFFDRGLSGGQYNHVFTSELESPKMTWSLKTDYNLSPSDMVFVTFAGYSEKGEGFRGVQGWDESWEQYRRTFLAGNKGLSGRYTRIFSPAVSNEFHFGWFTNPESSTSPDSEIQRNTRDAVGFTAGQFFPKNNPLNLIPNASYGGVPGAAEHVINGRFPLDDPYHQFTTSNKTTVIRGSHSLKLGVLVDWWGVGRGSNSSQFGAFAFARNVNNPLDTGYAYTNGAIGVFNTYTETSAIPYFDSRGRRYEWFVQDNWRVTRRLTLDYGLRASWFTPIYDRDRRSSAFFFSRYDPARAVRLVAPGRNARGQRVGVHPVTGEMYPESLIGALAPGVGDPGNGMVRAADDRSLPRALMENRGWHWGPRVGLAFDPFGKGKTSIRTGVGFFYDPVPQNQWQNLIGQAPQVQNPVVYYGQIATLLSSSGFLFPTAANTVDPAGHVPSVINYSFTIQHNIGYGTVVDVGYAGSVARHLLWARNLNAIPYGSNFRPENNDPTTNRPLPAAFLRPVAGYNNIVQREHAGTSNYHSLQFSLNRRFQKGLLFGASWTWSKAMDFVSGDGNEVSPFIDVRVWNYGLATFDRTHVFKLNWQYEVPTPGKNNAAARALLGGWQLSGITTFQSGAPMTAGFSTVTAVDITGSPTEGARINVTGNPVLPKNERTFDRFFRTEVFRLPAVGTFGNSARTLMRGPGINNWDMSLFRNIPLKEGFKLQYRLELYNAFNHTQFAGVVTGARFDAAGNQVNANFGQMNSARGARQIQMALRLSF